MNKTAFTFESAIAKFFKPSGADVRINFVECDSFEIEVVDGNEVVDGFYFMLNEKNEICWADFSHTTVLDEDRDAAAAKMVRFLRDCAIVGFDQAFAGCFNR